MRLKEEQFLKQYINLDGGMPSHDTIGRAMGMINPTVLENIQQKVVEYQIADEIDGIIASIEESFKLISIAGKTERGNGNVNQRPNHIVSASTNNYTCIGQELTDVKSNEIMAIPKLLDKINIKGAIVTIDAMGIQKNIAKKIIENKGNYCLAVKKNQGTLYDDISQYFENETYREKEKQKGHYKVSVG